MNSLKNGHQLPDEVKSHLQALLANDGASLTEECEKLPAEVRAVLDQQHVEGQITGKQNIVRRRIERALGITPPQPARLPNSGRHVAAHHLVHEPSPGGIRD